MMTLSILDLSTLERVGFGLLVESSLKGAILLLSAAVIVYSWKGASAAQRHLVWAITLGALLVLPVLSLAVPRWHIPTGHLARVETAQIAAFQSVAEPVIIVASNLPARAEMGRSPAADFSWKQAVLLVWLGGTLLLLGLLLHALVRVMVMTSRARPLVNGGCVDAVASLSRRMGMPRPPRLVEASGQTMPAAWGIIRPVVLLPSTAAGWPQARMETVLLHEIAHIRRRDIPTQLAAHVACALYWFNPLVWLAFRRLRLEGEQACDDAVLAAGVRATTYADHLLGFARLIRCQRGFALVTTPLAEPSQLPARIRALLEDERERRGVSVPVATTSLIAGAALSVLTAAATPASGAAADTTTGTHRAAPMQVVPTTSEAVSSSAPEPSQPSRAPAVVAEPAKGAAPSDTVPPVLLNLAEVNRRIALSYPSQLRQARVSGIALLELQIDSLGRVIDSRVLSDSDPAFGEAATRSLASARFAPARAEGQPVPSRVQWPVAFNAISPLSGPSGAADDLVLQGSLAAETVAQIRRQMSEIAAQSAAVAAQTPAVEAQTRAIAEALASIRAAQGAGLPQGISTPPPPRPFIAAPTERGANLPQRISDEVLREAITRHQPGVLERGLGEDQYVWFEVGPAGEVRRSGIAQKERADHFSSGEVQAGLAARSPGTRYEFMQLSHLSDVGSAGKGVAVAWIVVRAPRP